MKISLVMLESETFILVNVNVLTKPFFVWLKQLALIFEPLKSKQRGHGGEVRSQVENFQ